MKRFLLAVLAAAAAAHYRRQNAELLARGEALAAAAAAHYRRQNAELLARGEALAARRDDLVRAVESGMVSADVARAHLHGPARLAAERTELLTAGFARELDMRLAAEVAKWSS